MSPRKRRKRTELMELEAGDFTVAEGLVLRIRGTGERRARTWAVRFRPRQGTKCGPSQRVHIGRFDGPLSLDVGVLGLEGIPKDLVLDERGAQVVAHALLGLAARGIDPKKALNAADEQRRAREAEAARRVEQGTLTLASLIDRMLEARESELRPATVKGWRQLAKTVLAPLADRDPASISASEVRRLHKRIGATGRKVTANRGLELLSVVFTWAMKTEGDDGEPLLSSTPCARGAIETFPEASRTRWLKSHELKAVWNAIDSGGEPYGDAIKLLLWSGARRNEALAAEWREIDFGGRLWVVPAERSKTGLPRTIPLSAPAVRMLEERRAAAPSARWVFPSPVGAVGPVRSLQAVLDRVQKRCPGIEPWTLHDLRRTLRTGLSSLGVAVPVSEYILGHLPPKLTRTYDRHEPLAEAAAGLEAWARRLDSYVTGEPERENVVPFARPR